MNYNQTLEFLFSSLPAFENTGASAYKPGLERITAFCRHLGNPQRNFFTIHVAGTNGKGSVAHIIAAVLQQAGYRTGLFTSPHLQDFRERIRVDGEMIPKQKVVNFVDKHHDKMVGLELSFFEMTAAMAFDYFAQSAEELAPVPLRAALVEELPFGVDHARLVGGGSLLDHAVVAAVDFLHEETPLTISRRAYLEGMRGAASHTALHGRWQKLGEAPLTICDTLRIEH